MTVNLQYTFGVEGQTLSYQVWADGCGDIPAQFAGDFEELNEQVGVYETDTPIALPVNLYMVKIFVNNVFYQYQWVNITALTGTYLLEDIRSAALLPVQTYYPPPINPIRPS